MINSGPQTRYKIWHNNTNEIIWLWPRRACRKLTRSSAENSIRDGTITRCEPAMVMQSLATIFDSTKLNNPFVDSCDLSDRRLYNTVRYVRLTTEFFTDSSFTFDVVTEFRIILACVSPYRSPQHSAGPEFFRKCRHCRPIWWVLSRLIASSLANFVHLRESLFRGPGFDTWDITDGGHLWRLFAGIFLCVSKLKGLLDVMAIILLRDREPSFCRILLATLAAGSTCSVAGKRWCSLMPHVLFLFWTIS